MSYERTPEHRAKMSAALQGKKHDWRSGSTRPDVAAKIQAYWTPERREAKRQEMLKRTAARIVKSVGRCQRCDHDGSESRLGIHHKDRNKKNQKPSNLEVLCHRCHMQEHATAGETGWDVYHRRNSQRS